MQQMDLVDNQEIHDEKMDVFFSSPVLTCLYVELDTDRYAWHCLRCSGFGPSYRPDSRCKCERFSSARPLSCPLNSFCFQDGICFKCTNPSVFGFKLGDFFLGCEDCAVLPPKASIKIWKINDEGKIYFVCKKIS